MARSSTNTAIFVLGRKLDSVPFSPYHLMIIVVLGLVAIVDGYDLAMTGSLLVLAKGTAADDGRRNPISRCRR